MPLTTWLFPPLVPTAVSAADRARLLLLFFDRTPTTNPSGAVSDRVLTYEIQYHMLEPPSAAQEFLSGKWTRDEVLGYWNARQRQFLKDTMLVMEVGVVPTLPATLEHDLPPDWIATRAAAWAPSTLGSYYQEVPKGSGWEADEDPRIGRTWPTTSQARPDLYMDAEGPSLKFRLVPPPAAAGTLELLHAALSTLLTGEGVLLAVPDEFAPAIKYGVMADMLAKRGDGFDPDRAAYCEARYREGVAAATLIWLT